MMWSFPGPLGAAGRGAARALACATLATLAFATRASAQQCDSVWSRTSLAEMASRRVHVSLSAVTHLAAGGEYDRLEWETPRNGPAIPLCEFVGIAAGLRRRSVAYDTVTWFLPDNALVDVPLSFEYDALVGVGRDRATDAPALHVDAWAGKMWFVGRNALVVGDIWGSGFRSAGRWSAATLRGGVNYERAARRGLWNARLDFGVPVLRSGEVRRRPFVAIGITPWLEQDRDRDGRGIR